MGGTSDIELRFFAQGTDLFQMLIHGRQSLGVGLSGLLGAEGGAPHTGNTLFGVCFSDIGAVDGLYRTVGSAQAALRAVLCRNRHKLDNAKGLVGTIAR